MSQVNGGMLYAPYEVTALRRLTQKYGIGETFLDRLLRERRLVDLFAVVRGGLIASEKNYSIKSMEAFYGRSREGEVTTAGGSVVAYEKWRETGAPETLEEIRAYNEVDCISTEELRDWLVTIRPDGPWPVAASEALEQEAAADADAEELNALLDTADLDEARRAMLFDLGLFHRREAKPAWWSVFDSHGKELEELFDDLEALGGLSAIGKPEPEKKSFKRRYTYPPQETKLRAGQRPTVPRSEGIASVQVLEHDRGAREITVKAGPSVADVLGSSLPALRSLAVVRVGNHSLGSNSKLDGSFRPLADLRPLLGMLHRGSPKPPFAADAQSGLRPTADERDKTAVHCKAALAPHPSLFNLSDITNRLPPRSPQRQPKD